MRLESDRLFLYPISDEAMAALIDNERDPELRQAYAQMLAGCVSAPAHRVWYAAWFMELKDSPGVIAGDLCFKGPCTDGAVEIGYGLREGFCGKGYMTEAVKTVTRWALTRPGVTRVEAETDPGNAASQRVLSACGFVPNGETGEEGPRFVLTAEGA